MTLSLRILQDLFCAVSKDVSRPHPFADERIGFLFAKKGSWDSTDKLVLGTDYQAVADGHYVRDPRVGAKIGGHAIRSAMERLLNEEIGAFHVHLHPHYGRPYFSKVDLANLPSLIQGFKNVSPNVPHGALVLSRDSCHGICWMPGAANFQTFDQISIVGQPLILIG